MRKKSIIIIALFSLLIMAGLRLAAEVAVEEVVQVGRFVFYRDHADPHKYYYVPDQPRLATKRDGTPEFTFIKYTKTDGATKGGVLHFLVTWGFTSGELSSAESALQSIDPQAKLAGPVPFKEGMFQVISATAGKDGIFNRRIVGEGKAPVLPGQKAAVSIALTEEGASLLWESFKNPTSEVSVQYVLKFSGITPAFQAKLKVDWDKVYSQHDIKAAVEGTVKVVKLRGDLGATLGELRQKGAIQLEIVGENENMQKLLETVYNHILQLMCEKVSVGAGAAKTSSSFPVISPARQNNIYLSLLPTELFQAGNYSERFLRSPFEEEKTFSSGPNAGFFEMPVIQQEDCPASAKQQANLLENRAKSFLSAGQFREAVEYYEKAYAACADPRYLYLLGSIWEENLKSYPKAGEKYKAFILATESSGRYPELRDKASQRLKVYDDAVAILNEGITVFQDAEKLDKAGHKEQAKTRYLESINIFRRAQELVPDSATLKNNIASVYFCIGDMMSDRSYLEKALSEFKQLWEFLTRYPDARGDLNQRFEYINEKMIEINKKLQSLPADETTRPQSGNVQQAQGQQATTTGQTTTQTGQTGQAAQQTTSGQATSGTQTTPPPTTTSGAQTVTQTGRPQATQPTTPAPEVKPIVSVLLGYSFKRTKLSGRYEVDMRRRLREDREIVMSGNISGIYQKYGEDKRFFTVVSLDDPTFQERSIEVILDGQDAEDFKNYVNSVSVIFRRQRLAGPVMTGEVKFFEQQFAERGNRLSFKYGRVNEAATEWLNYEYKTKWNFYGGVEWESDWVKTSDSVLTLTPPVRRRTIEISVDEDNILQNKIKAVAIQIKHNIYGKDILKEVVINYDKGDPLQVNYTYMHEEGKPGYSYRVIWLTLDGKQVETNWVNREGPFIYAVFGK
ncbi:MAG: tetratricopeptide repeat protein [Candidatus Saccharicenans sp.]|uniref:tetratricopeptide repeat protein n=1 Tax=Candidatus Saccharicenans sp. TaxID=2819258 RepID=UPI004049A370